MSPWRSLARRLELSRWRARGKLLRDWRLADPYVSPREAARRYGVSVRALEDAEAGGVDPAPLIARVRGDL